MAEYDDRIPERLQLLRVGLGGKDELGVFLYSISGDYYPSFCLAPATDDPETMDVAGAIEQTLHDLLDYGGTDKDVRAILGLVPHEELDEETLEGNEYTDIDLGWCIDGQLLSFERMDPEASDVHAILTDRQVQHIEEWFDALPADECLAKADAVAHDPSYKVAATRPDPLADLTTGKWRVHLVMPGGRYGRDDALTYEPEEAVRHGSGLPLVEFYDTSQDPVTFPGGQFVSRYYMDTLLGTDSLKLGVPIRDMSAFSLDGGIPAWTVSGDDLKRVADWLDAAHETLHPQAVDVHSFDYQMLDRLRSDCDYYLGACSEHSDGPDFMASAQKHLWAGSVEAQVAKMRELYDRLPVKPEWLSSEDIDRYESRMLGARDAGCEGRAISLKDMERDSREAADALSGHETRDDYEPGAR